MLCLTQPQIVKESPVKYLVKNFFKLSLKKCYNVTPINIHESKRWKKIMLIQIRRKMKELICQTLTRKSCANVLPGRSFTGTPKVKKKLGTPKKEKANDNKKNYGML